MPGKRVPAMRTRSVAVLLGAVCTSLLLTGTAFATSVVGPSWVPSGTTGCWSVDGWDYPVDVDWGDGRGTTSAAQPFCHQYRGKGPYQIEVSRVDIDAGRIVLGRRSVSTTQPTMQGPFVPGTTTPTSPVAGDTVEFRFSIPGEYHFMWHGTDGSWGQASSTTFSTSFSTAGDHTVGLRLGHNDWSSDYSRTWSVTVGAPPTTTTTTTTSTTTTSTTTTTSPPETTTSTAPSDTTTTTISVAARDELDEEEEPTQTAVPGGSLTVSPEEEPEEEVPAAASGLDGTAPPAGGSGGVSTLGLVLMVGGGLAAAAGIITLKPQAASRGALADDMAVPRWPAIRTTVAVVGIVTGIALSAWAGFQIFSGAFDEAASSGGFDVKPGLGSVEDPGSGEFADPALGFDDNYCDTQTDLPYDECAVLIAQRQMISNPTLHGWDLEEGPCSWRPSLNRGVFCDDGHVVGMDLSGVTLSGITPLLKMLPALTELSCSECALGPEVPSVLLEMESLRRVRLASNGFTGPIPSGILNPEMRSLDLSDNEFVGGVPGRWNTDGGNLEFLILDNNQLDGSVTAISGMRSLINLNLSNNSFTGALPVLYGGTENTSLLRIDLSNNGFTGPIWDMKIVARWIDLSDNQLTGGIPRGTFAHRVSIASEPDVIDELIDFFGGPDAISWPNETETSSARLDLSDNDLFGLIPASVAGFHGSVDVSGNRLWGPIPRVDWLEAGHGSYTSRGLERVYRDNDCLMSDDAEHASVLYKLDAFWNNGC